MTKIYIAFYDDEEGGSRENWNTFYTPWVAATTRDRAHKLAKEAIIKSAKESILRSYGVDLNKVTIDSIEDPDMREEVQDEYEIYTTGMHIEIQEGELE